MDNKNNNSIWNPQQEKVINDLHKKIDDVKVELNQKIDDVKNEMNLKFDKIFRHLGIE